MGEKSSPASSRGRGKGTIWKFGRPYSQGLTSGETPKLEPNLLGFSQSLTDLKERKYPTPSNSYLSCERRKISNFSTG